MCCGVQCSQPKVATEIELTRNSKPFKQGLAWAAVAQGKFFSGFIAGFGVSIPFKCPQGHH